MNAVKWRTTIKALFLYINLFLSVMLESLSSSCTSTFCLTNKYVYRALDWIGNSKAEVVYTSISTCFVCLPASLIPLHTRFTTPAWFIRYIFIIEIYSFLIIKLLLKLMFSSLRHR